MEDVISQKLSDHVPKNGQLQNADSFDNDNSGGKPERNSSTPTNQTGNHNNSTNTIVIDDNTMEEDSKKEDAGDGKIKWSCDNYEKNYIIDNPRSRTKKKNNLKKKKSNPEEWSVSFSIDGLIKKIENNDGIDLKKRPFFEYFTFAFPIDYIKHMVIHTNNNIDARNANMRLQKNIILHTDLGELINFFGLILLMIFQ